jgi:hypothetical protein
MRFRDEKFSTIKPHTQNLWVYSLATRRVWIAAMEALILVATLGGPTMFARIGVMRALNRRVERVFNPSRKNTHWRRRKLVRDR